MRSALFVTLALTVSACTTGAGSQPILIGEHRYPPLPAKAPIQVFMKDTDIHQNFEVVADVSTMDLGKWQILTLQDALPTLEDKARATGANAIIIDSYQPLESAEFSATFRRPIACARSLRATAP